MCGENAAAAGESSSAAVFVCRKSSAGPPGRLAASSRKFLEKFVKVEICRNLYVLTQKKVKKTVAIFRRLGIIKHVTTLYAVEAGIRQRQALYRAWVISYQEITRKSLLKYFKNGKTTLPEFFLREVEEMQERV